jgi:hypothetical protein
VGRPELGVQLNRFRKCIGRVREFVLQVPHESEPLVHIGIGMSAEKSAINRLGLSKLTRSFRFAGGRKLCGDVGRLSSCCAQRKRQRDKQKRKSPKRLARVVTSSEAETGSAPLTSSQGRNLEQKQDQNMNFRPNWIMR